MVVGRKSEIKKLNELYNSDSAELVAVYGRRRVGKTYLIDETFTDRIVFRHAGLSPIDDRTVSKNGQKNRMKNQLEHFYHSLKRYGLKNGNQPKSWQEAFYLLEDFLIEKEKSTKRLLIFIDEIQWLDTPRADFMTGFEAFWNGWACHKKNVMLIVCGSSSSWILNHFINNHGGLYGRLTYEIKLKPFSLLECEEFFAAQMIVMSRYDIAQSYMMVGGIPYYLRYFNRELSLAQNINNVFFSDNAILKDEFDRIFASLFVNPEVMKRIVTALSSKNRGLTRRELTEKTGISDGGELSSQLKSLIAGDFIMKYCSFGNSRREEYYKLTDPFCIFYLKFVKDSKKTDWINIADSSQVTTWKGYAFENVCWNHIKQIKISLGISGVSTTESLWSKRADEESDGAQIDLIIERKDNVINLCEIKFYSDEFAVNKDYHFTLEKRKHLLSDLVSKKTSIHNTLITTYGVKHNEYFGDFIHVVVLDDLFRE